MTIYYTILILMLYLIKCLLISLYQILLSDLSIRRQKEEALLMENNQTIEALLEEIKVLKETVITINASLTTLVKITEEREKRFAERGARTQGDRNSSDRGNFRPRSDRGDSSWGNSGGFSRRDRDDRNRKG